MPRSKLKKCWEITISIVSLALLVGPALAAAILSTVAVLAHPETRHWIGLGWVGVIIVMAIVWRWDIQRETASRKAILQYCETAGCLVVKIAAFKTHYRVTFIKNGREQIGKCLASRERVEWLRGDPNT